MPIYFPTPYYDELLYSMIARYHIRIGNTSPKATIEELFGSRTISAVVDMPCGIDAIAKSIPPFMALDPEKLIHEHTLFPYYTAFLPKKRIAAIKKSMRGDFGGDIHTRTGIMASTIKVPGKLKFCPECNRLDKVRFGELYWHRSHQIPGMFVCQDHNIFLIESTVDIHGLNKHEFVAANEDNCKVAPFVVSHQSIDVEKLIAISKDITWLLNNYNAVRGCIGVEKGFREQYTAILIEKGLATVNGRVYQQQFIDDFRNYFGDNLLRLLQSDIEYDFENNWVSGIVRKHRKSFHPLRQLLMMKYLRGGIEEFLNTNSTYSPFGTGPWPCLNAASDHYHKSIIRKVAISHDGDTKQPVGTFECSCGFVYSRRGPDKCEKDLYRIGRIKRFGALWERKLKVYAEKNRLSLRETARRLNVDTNTVKRYADKLDLKSAWGTEIKDYRITSDSQVTTLIVNGDIDIYRKKWLELQQNYSENSKTELRKLANDTYIWLYRHDRIWLDDNSPEKKNMAPKHDRVDWDQRDEDILKKAKSVTQNVLKKNNKPTRISIGLIGKLTGCLALLEKHLDKLPLTKDFFETVTENESDFRKRRALWAIDDLEGHGIEPKVWNVMRKAGIRTEYKNEVEGFIQREINSRLNNRDIHIAD